MPEPRLRPLVERFGAMLLEIPVFAGVYGNHLKMRGFMRFRS
jgi:hypothetical protein